MTPSTSKPSSGIPSLSLKGGGWVIVVACLLSLAALVWAAVSAILRPTTIGNGTDITSYHFDLENLTVDQSILAASGFPRDFLDVYAFPETIQGSDILAFNQKHRGPWVVTADRVVGIEIGDKARAYPVRCLNAHEIIQDTLNGERFTVTYSPLADAPIVVMSNPKTDFRDFGISGLLCNSALVMYNRDSDSPSLWCPVLGNAIAGPAAGEKIKQLPVVNLCTWRDWLEIHPDTTIILPDPGNARRYKEWNYSRYFNDRMDHLRYHVSPRPPEHLTGTKLPRLKARIVAVTAGGKTRVWPLALFVKALKAKGADEGTIKLKQAGVPLEFIVRELPQSVYVRATEDSEITVMPMLFFAWWCCHSDSVEEELVHELPPDAVVTPRPT